MELETARAVWKELKNWREDVTNTFIFFRPKPKKEAVEVQLFFDYKGEEQRSDFEVHENVFDQPEEVDAYLIVTKMCMAFTDGELENR